MLTQIEEFYRFKFFSAVFAVKGFFAISGFLVMRSYLSSSSVLDFAEKRLRRIYPAYISVVVVCLVLGVFCTYLGPYDYLTNNETRKYLLANSVFMNFLQPTLPMVFHDNPIQTINGSLWTIKIEVALYLFIPIVSALYIRFGVVRTTVISCALSIAWVWYFTYVVGGIKGLEYAKQVPGQLACFVIGACFAVSKSALRNVVWVFIASASLYMIFNHDYARLVLEPLFYSSFVIFLSTSAVKQLDVGKFGDVSYGIYLFHFPIIQVLIYVGLFKINPWLGGLVSISLTIGIAWLSWQFVEKKFLKRSSHYVVAAS